MPAVGVVVTAISVAARLLAGCCAAQTARPAPTVGALDAPSPAPSASSRPAPPPVPPTETSRPTPLTFQTPPRKSPTSATAPPSPGSPVPVPVPVPVPPPPSTVAVDTCGLSCPSPKDVCKHIVEIAEKGLPSELPEELRAGVLSDCTRDLAKDQKESPAKYACRSRCVMKAQSKDAVEQCETVCK